MVRIAPEGQNPRSCTNLPDCGSRRIRAVIDLQVTNSVTHEFVNLPLGIV